jgi:hypothetical protein
MTMFAVSRTQFERIPARELVVGRYLMWNALPADVYVAVRVIAREETEHGLLALTAIITSGIIEPDFCGELCDGYNAVKRVDFSSDPPNATVTLYAAPERKLYVLQSEFMPARQEQKNAHV